MAESRREARKSAMLEVRLKSASVGEFVERYCVDISTGGVFVRSDDPLPVGTLLRVEMQIADGTPRVHGVGRVVWVRKEAKATEALPCGMGIKFVKMNDESRALVESFVEQRRTETSTFDRGEKLAEEAAKSDATGEVETRAEPETATKGDRAGSSGDADGAEAEPTAGAEVAADTGDDNGDDSGSDDAKPDDAKPDDAKPDDAKPGAKAPRSDTPASKSAEKASGMGTPIILALLLAAAGACYYYYAFMMP